ERSGINKIKIALTSRDLPENHLQGLRTSTIIRMGKTLFEKVWDAHVVTTIPGGPDVLYIDKHLIHEVTSPQAFAGLEKRGIGVFRTKNIIATADHNVPTKDQHLPIKEALSRSQVQKLTDNCKKFGVTLYGLGHEYQGIVHV